MRPHKDISGKEQMANGQAEQMVDLNSRKSYKDAARIIVTVNINLQ